MATIEDVGPTLSNAPRRKSVQFPSGRMLSVDSSDDGQLVFAGSFSSHLWRSEDGGESWSQVGSPQPDAGQFGVPGAIGGYCVTSVAVGPDSARWSVERNPRVLADLTGTGRADIVGFGDTGVWTALSNGDGTFQPPRFVLGDFGFDQGWRVDRHPRFLVDVTGNGTADIVGFGNAGVYVALSNGDGTFGFTPAPVIDDLGFEAGGWRVEKHPRFLADVTGTNGADIVGFGDAGVYVALSNGDGTFGFTPVPVIDDFGFEAGGWRVEKHPRFLADVTGTNGADIVGFGDAGVYVALSNGDGTFGFTPVPVIDDFGFEAGGWRVEKHPRFLADTTADGSAEIVGFGDAGVLVGVNKGDGTFVSRPLFVIPNFGFRDDGKVEQQGPFLPDPNVSIVQASGGHTGTVFYVGGDRALGLWKWTEGMPGWQRLVPGGGATEARRFFAHAYDPNVVYLLDTDHVRRSDDGGVTWQVDASLEQQLTSGGRIPAARGEGDDGQGDHYDVILSDMQFDPFDPLRRFAVGLAGAFVTADGATWERLLDTAALRGRPANCYFDEISQPSDPALYVGFAGRSIVKISGFAGGIILSPELRPGPGRAAPEEAPEQGATQALVHLRDGRVGTVRAAPDDQVLITFEDGDSLIVDADQWDGGHTG